jgi:hypothetical protein
MTATAPGGLSGGEPFGPFGAEDAPRAPLAARVAVGAG